MQELLEWMEYTEDTRQQTKVRHTLKDILVIVLFATLANADDWVEMALFAESYQDYLRKYIELKNGDNVGYTVPQKVRPANVDKMVEVMFRVRNVFKNVEIKVRSNGVQLASFKREHMAPGEMEKIVIPKVFLDKVENGEITVSVE